MAMEQGTGCVRRSAKKGASSESPRPRPRRHRPRTRQSRAGCHSNAPRLHRKAWQMESTGTIRRKMVCSPQAMPVGRDDLVRNLAQTRPGRSQAALVRVRVQVRAAPLPHRRHLLQQCWLPSTLHAQSSLCLGQRQHGPSSPPLPMTSGPPKERPQDGQGWVANPASRVPAQRPALPLIPFPALPQLAFPNQGGVWEPV